jgi:NADP-dependent aldehyde dehydrogenase
MAPRAWTNPRTGESLDLAIEDHSSADVARIAQLSHRAWLTYRNASMHDRARVLVTIADALETRCAEVVAIADEESALGEPRLVGEVARTVFQLKMFATALEQGTLFPAEIDEAREGNPPAGRPQLVRNFVPLGPVAVFGASNFPFAFGVLGGDFASALAAGCSVVVKEHSAHPRLSIALVDIARTALGAHSHDPDLVLSIRGTEAGAHLVQDQAIAAVGFTGSVSGGRHLFNLAHSRVTPIPFYGELGSVNPVVVSRKAAAARGDQIAQGFVDSLLLGAGQFCTKPSILIYPEGSSIIEAAQVALSTTEPVALLTTRIASAYRHRVEEMTQGNATNLLSAKPVAQAGSWVRPALFHTSAAEMLIEGTDLREECFGPAAVAVAYSTDDEALALASIGGGVLVACVHGEDDDPLAADIIRALVPRAGRIAWNSWPTGVAVAPAQMHGGPYPAATVPSATSVGLHAANRFARPIVFQSMPESMRIS